MKFLALIALLPLHAHAADFQPHCYCAPISNAGKYALCVEKDVSPRGLSYDCEAGFYVNQQRCEKDLDQLTAEGSCQRL